MTTDLYLSDIRLQYHKHKKLAEKAMVQVSDRDFFRSLDQTPNSIAHIVKHLAGNLRSRWLDFLTTDGEKPDRNRDSEFVITDADSRESLMQRWEDGWAIAHKEVEGLTAEDLERTITIRSEPYIVVEAIQRNILHCSYHIGQIVYLARFFAGTNWRPLSVALGQSEALNRRMRESGGTSDSQKEDLV